MILEDTPASLLLFPVVFEYLRRAPGGIRDFMAPQGLDRFTSRIWLA